MVPGSQQESREGDTLGLIYALQIMNERSCCSGIQRISSTFKTDELAHDHVDKADGQDREG